MAYLFLGCAHNFLVSRSSVVMSGTASRSPTNVRIKENSSKKH
jgi:hypothetical protein